MSKRIQSLRRVVLMLSMGGATLGLFGSTFGAGIPGGGCNYVNYADYAALYTTAGQAAIQSFSNGVYSGHGKDFDAIVRTPATKFAQTLWANFVNARIPDDLPNNPIVKR